MATTRRTAALYFSRSLETCCWAQWRLGGRTNKLGPAAALASRGRFFSTSSTSKGGSSSSTPPTTTARPRYDPTAKRPNKLCDPYGQGGKPLEMEAAKALQATVHPSWRLEQGVPTNDNDEPPPPAALVRDFIHNDFGQGARFLGNHVATVAQLQNHFPALVLDRRIVRKQWQVVTTVRCHTKVLGGLSTDDFYLAMVRTMRLAGLRRDESSSSTMSF
jgi:pterin-4a-carbinolamine dehydratase